MRSLSQFVSFLLAIPLIFAQVTRVQAEAVVVYTSVDEVLSAPVLEKISQETGLDIRPVFDSEATKTTGLYLRILQEASRPRADVFWNSEFSRTLLLEKEGLLAPLDESVLNQVPERFRGPAGNWVGFTVRARVLAYNTDKLALAEVPTQASQLLEPQWEGKVCWADPRFGTTATHCGALLALHGKDWFQTHVLGWSEKFHRLAGNGEVARMVAEGVFPLGLTDTDDVWRLKLEGKPIDAIPFDAKGDGTLLIPNTVAILKGAPHPEVAGKFVQALLAPEIEAFLAASSSRQIPVREGVPVPADLEGMKDIPTLDVPFEKVAASVDEAVRMLR